MMPKKNSIRTQTSFVALCMLFLGLAISASGSTAATTHLSLTFFTVDTGDATLAQLPSKEEILIDGGPTEKLQVKIGHILPFFDRTIEMIVITQCDAGKITGLVGVVRDYRIGRILVPSWPCHLAAYDEISRMALTRHIPMIKAHGGQVFEFSSGVRFEVLDPLNDSLIVARIVYHDFVALFVGNSHHDDHSARIIKRGNHEIVTRTNSTTRSFSTTDGDITIRTDGKTFNL